MFLHVYLFHVNKGRYFIKVLEVINIDFMKLSQFKLNEQKTEIPLNQNLLFKMISNRASVFSLLGNFNKQIVGMRL